MPQRMIGKAYKVTSRHIQGEAFKTSGRVNHLWCTKTSLCAGRDPTTYTLNKFMHLKFMILLER